MRFWIKSIPPLLVRKTYAESMTELMEWIEELLADTRKEYKKREEKFPPKEDFDVFKKCFILLSVDTNKFPHTFEALTVDPPSKAQAKRAKEKFSTLWDEWDKVAAKPKKKLGRRKKSDKIQTAIATPKKKSTTKKPK